MPSRMILPVVAGATLILTLYFAAAAGAQDTTTAQTAAPETTSTSTADALETTTSDNNARNADNFRCDFFLRAVRDDRGALKAQYQNDDLIVERFEQCVSGDVLRNTIPNRRLPFTGGMSLLGLGAIGLVAAIVGIAMLRAVIRRVG